jgi:hypothetical protein
MRMPVPDVLRLMVARVLPDPSRALPRARSVLLATVLLTMTAVSPGPAAEKQVVYGYSFKKTNSTTEELSWIKIVKKLNAALGSAQQLNIYVGTCHSGGLISAAGNQQDGLSMPHVIGTSTSEDKLHHPGRGPDKNPPGRLKATDGLFFYGYSEYVTKRLRGGMPKAKELHDDAKASWAQDPAYKAGEVPQYRRGQNADEDLKLDAGTKSSHALVFVGNYNGLDWEPLNECALALKNLGFTMGPVTDTKTVRYYTDTSTPSDVNGVHIYGPGKIVSFDAALDTLKALATADQGKVVVDLFLDGHGAELQANARENPNGPPAGPGRGAHILAGTQLDVPMSAEAWADLKEEVVTDRPDCVRGAVPAFFLSVSDARVTQPFAVTLGGIPLEATC